jgi:flagellar biogenesis protein FliO
MPILKILPDAISNTASYVFGNVTTTSITAGGTDLKTLAQSAYDAANAAGSSATVTAAFEQANVTAGGLITANSRITISEGVDVGQNTRMTIIEGVDTTQNTNITIATNAATAAFAQANATAGGLTTANARITVAEGVNVGQNTRMDIIEGVDVGQNTRMSIIEGVDATQNTNITILQGVDTTQNTNITAADTKAQAAFNKANDAYTLANTANSAAGSGGASLTSFTATVDTFTGNGSQTEFTLSAVPDSEDNTFVFLNGVYQEKGTYSIAAANVVLTGVATANDTIEVTTVAGSIMNVSPTAYSTRIYQGNGSTNTFTISVGHTANTVMVFNNGVCQFPGDDYTVSGTTLTYVLTPQSDETIQIREMPIDKLVPLTQPVMRRYTANGAQTQFTVTAGQTANSMFVYENGICQVPVSDYTVSGITLTFVTAPIANVVVQIREMSI